MITLLTYPPAFGEFAASPFCVKAAWLLNLSGQAWQREDLQDPRKMPHQKLPAIRVDGNLIPDSDNMRTYLEARGADFEAGLSDLDKASARAFIRMAEEHMYFHIVLDRWANDAVWPIVRDTYFDMIPKLMRGFVTRRLRKQCLDGMRRQGLGRLTEAERMVRLEPDLAAISARLWHGPFLFGDTPTAADASVAAMLGQMRATPVKTRLQQRIAKDEMLSDYIDRCKVAMDQPRS